MKTINADNADKNPLFPPDGMGINADNCRQHCLLRKPAWMLGFSINADNATGCVRLFVNGLNKERERGVCFIYKRLETRMDRAFESPQQLSALSALFICLKIKQSGAIHAA